MEVCGSSNVNERSSTNGDSLCYEVTVPSLPQDVEANTVRLKEHGQDVLVLQKNAQDVSGGVTGSQNQTVSNIQQSAPNGQQIVAISNITYNASHYK